MPLHSGSWGRVKQPWGWKDSLCRLITWTGGTPKHCHYLFPKGEKISTVHSERIVFFFCGWGRRLGAAIIWEQASPHSTSRREERGRDPRLLSAINNQQRETQRRGPRSPQPQRSQKGGGQRKTWACPDPRSYSRGPGGCQYQAAAPDQGRNYRPAEERDASGEAWLWRPRPWRGNNQAREPGRPPADRKQSRARATADGSARLQQPALRRQPGTDLHLGSPSPETILSLRGGGRQGKEGEARPGC